MLFTCDICSKVFTEKRTLMRHIATAHNNKSCDCILCKKSFKRKNCLRRHQLHWSTHNLVPQVLKLFWGIFGTLIPKMTSVFSHQLWFLSYGIPL